jgi:hypothetical protein
MRFAAVALAVFALPASLAAALLLGVAQAQAVASITPGSSLLDLFTWSADGQAYTYGQALARTPNSALNPGNAFAGLPNWTLTGELRPNLRANSAYVDLVLQPRAISVFETGGVADRESLRGYIQQGFVRAKPTSDIVITVGRELLTWGPAFFRSPSNPYYFNNARLNPIRELSGIDLARIGYTLNPNLSVTGGVVFNSGQDLVTNNLYRNSTFLKADYRGTNYLGSLVMASLRSEQVFFGGYAQATVNDAILLYGEFGTTSSNTALNILPSGSTGFFSRNAGGRRKATALAGGSYTFENGHTLSVEYLYNGFGYSGSQLHQYFAQARAAGLQQLLGGSLGGLGTENVGYAAARSVDLLGQHYLYSQYQNNPAQGDTLWRLMAAQNLVDHSAQLSVYLEQNLTDRMSLFALGVANVGPHDSDFGAVFRDSLTAGLKFFLF